MHIWGTHVHKCIKYEVSMSNHVPGGGVHRQRCRRRCRMTPMMMMHDRQSMIVSCTEDFQGIRFFFYNCEIQKLSQVFT